MIEFGPKGMKSYGFGSGQGSTRGRVIRSGNYAIYPDSSGMIQSFQMLVGPCSRCGGYRNRDYAFGLCLPCVTDRYAPSKTPEE